MQRDRTREAIAAPIKCLDRSESEGSTISVRSSPRPPSHLTVSIPRLARFY
jgi:hypothetical protein